MFGYDADNLGNLGIIITSLYKPYLLVITDLCVLRL